MAEIGTRSGGLISNGRELVMEGKKKNNESMKRRGTIPARWEKTGERKRAGRTKKSDSGGGGGRRGR